LIEKKFICQIRDSPIQFKNVRLDLFLKTSRLVKRRTVAQELCDAGRVLVNGAAAKPAKEVRPGDVLTLAFSSRTVEIEVLGLPLKSRTAPSEESYRIRSEERRRDEHDQ
jgi:ribosomal 50S subunit-recycling heat shock protein